MNILLRPPAPTDVDPIARVLKAAFDSIANKHNFPLDFPTPESAAGLVSFFTGQPAAWGVVAEVDGRFAGSNFLDCRNPIAAVGPITVDPAFHGHGVGRKLMEAVIARGREINVPGIRLVQDAFNTTSMSLYASVGFEVKEPLALMMGKVRSRPAGGGEVRAMRAEDLSGCGELCRRVHGFDRYGELADAIKMCGAMVLVRGGRIAAYASAPWLWFLNHGVAEDESAMRELLVGASAAGDGPLALLVPTRRAEFFRWCLAEGLRMVKPMSLMAMGEYWEPAGAWYASVEY